MGENITERTSLIFNQDTLFNILSQMYYDYARFSKQATYRNTESSVKDWLAKYHMNVYLLLSS